MSTEKDEFESVKGSGVTWNPTSTGTKKGGDYTALKPSAKSFLRGYYLETKHEQGPDNNKQIHVFKLDSAGDPAHFSDEVVKGDDVSVWGNAVLDDLVTKVKAGQYVQVLWEGMKKSKNGNDYHVWDLGISKVREPLAIDGASSLGNIDAEPETVESKGAEIPAEEAPVAETKTAPATVAADDDPFA